MGQVHCVKKRSELWLPVASSVLAKVWRPRELAACKVLAQPSKRRVFSAQASTDLNVPHSWTI